MKINLHKTTDGSIWADEFMRIIVCPDHPVPIDKELMSGWFANAIMAGYDQAKWEQSATLHQAEETK